MSGSYAAAWALFTAINGNAAQYKAGTTFKSSLSEALAAQIAGMAQEVWTEHASITPAIEAIQGYYPTGTYVVRQNKVSLWGGNPNDLGDVYDLTVKGGAVYWAHASASVTSVSEFAAEVVWSNGDVFANAKALCRGPKVLTDSPATMQPSPPLPATSDDSGLSNGEKAGLGIGVTFGVLLLVGVAVALIMCSRKKVVGGKEPVDETAV